MQVWSNPQAVQDYKDLLDGNAPEDTIDQPSVIIGRGKLGTALASMGMGEDVVLGRGEAIPDSLPCSSGRGEGGETAMLQNFPIYVCVPEEEVAALIDSCPDDKKEDLVFMSSGCLEPLLKSRGMCRGEQTQATLYFSVDKLGGRAVDAVTVIGTDGRGEPKLAGETAVCGKWKGAFAMRLQQSPFGLHCSTEYYLEWRRVMFEKLIFDCAVNLVGALHRFPTVGYVVQYHAEELVDMLFELKNTLRSTLAVSLMNGYPERLIAYGDQVGDRQTTRMDARTFKWYNEFFYDISNTALKSKFGDPCPMHTEYLNYGRDKGIFTF
ncbi:unnamed protein product [Ectocarpus sp. 12 AP-2014]